MIVVFIPASGEAFSNIETDGSLASLQKLVEGYIERVALPFGACLLVNEEGVLLGLPQNVAASRVAGKPICGNAVVVGDDDRPEFTDVPEVYKA